MTLARRLELRLDLLPPTPFCLSPPLLRGRDLGRMAILVCDPEYQLSQLRSCTIFGNRKACEYRILALPTQGFYNYISLSKKHLYNAG